MWGAGRIREAQLRGTGATRPHMFPAKERHPGICNSKSGGSMEVEWEKVDVWMAEQVGGRTHS